MSYIALYRKWRPLVFEDVVEQEHVVKTLKNSVTTGRIVHAYLFCGTRGTGKTTMAKIFSRAINCLQPKDGDPCNECEICRGILSDSLLDVIEIDAASNNSVDNVRGIRDEVVYAPTQAKYKVYIIDEVHMLSIGAFNALLKTLEEPPEHVVFILATTDPHKLPATILSRCQRFDFRRISVESIMGRITSISQASGVDIHKEAARMIARMAEGALRDAISILDQCIALGNADISYLDVLKVVGIVNDDFIADIVDAILAREVDRILELVDRLTLEGKDITQFVADLVMYYRNLLICKVTGKPEEILEVAPESIQRLKIQGAGLGREEIIFIVKELSALESAMKWSLHPRILLEVTLIKICEHSFSAVDDSVLERLAALESKVSKGLIAAPEKGQGEARPNIGRVEVREAVTEKKPSPNQPKPAAGNVKAGKGLEIWGNITRELKDMGRMVIYSNILSTRAVELENGIIGVVFAKDATAINRMLISKTENLEVLEGLLSSKLGREVRVKCLNEEDLAAAGSESQDKPPEEKDEFMEKAEALGKRLNMPINVIDE
jgi:DNA polymerase III subunit gamma/tau